MKNKYETPEMEIFKFTLDVCATLRTSQNDDSEGGLGGDNEDIDRPGGDGFDPFG